MKTSLKDYLEQKGRGAWFDTHLKKDSEFKHEAAELRARIAIQTPHGLYHPTEARDFELLEDPEKEVKSKLVEDFMVKWNVPWDYALLNFLIVDDENLIPPEGKVGFAVGTDKERRMFNVQIPFSVQHEELEYLWQMLLISKRDAGIDITKRPRKNTFTARKTEIAYYMWKARSRGKSWTQVVKGINDKYKTDFDIKSAQRHLKAYGYYC